MAVNRYELSQEQRIAKLESEISLRDANIYADKKSLELYAYVDGRMRNIESQIAAQAVHNATSDAVLGCMQGQIAQLMGLTKLVVPNTSVCPGWGNVTVTPAAAAAAGA
jgi:ATP-dependent exoDNAse (exonuclease V) alpha subunit